MSHGPTPAAGHGAAHGTTAPAAGHGVAHAAQEAVQEGSEEAMRELMRVRLLAQGQTGPEAIATMSQNYRLTDVILKAFAHGGTNFLVNAFAKARGIDPGMSRMLSMVISGMIGGAIEQKIDEHGLRDPATRRQLFEKAYAKVLPVMGVADSGLPALTWYTGEGSDLVHLAKRDHAGVLVKFPGQDHAASMCDCLGRARIQHVIAHPARRPQQRRDRDGRAVPAEPAEQAVPFLVDDPTDLATALAAKGVLCPRCFPGSVIDVPATAHAAHELSFEDKVYASAPIRDVLDAVHWRLGKQGHFRRVLAIDLMEEVYEGKVPYLFLLAICEDLHLRVTIKLQPDGRRDHAEIDEEGADVFLDRLDAIGSELTALNKTRGAVYRSMETLRKSLDGFGLSPFVPWVTGAIALTIPVLYVGWGAGTALLYGIAWIGPFGMPLWAQFLGMLLATLSSLFFVLPLYAPGGVKELIGIKIHEEGDSMAQTARSVPALLFGFGAVSICAKMVAFIAGFGESGMFWTNLSLVAAFLTLFASDRIMARHTGVHLVDELAQAVKRNQLVSISIMTGVALLVAGGFAYQQNALGKDPFFLRVDAGVVMVDDKPVVQEFIASPRGTVFLVEDVLGQVEASRRTVGTVCVVPGTVVDLPGYAEVEHKYGKQCAAGMVAYTVAPRLFGRFGDGSDTVVEYASLEELYAASHGGEATVGDNGEEPATSGTATTSVTPGAQAAPSRQQPKARQDNGAQKLPCYRTPEGCD